MLHRVAEMLQAAVSTWSEDSLESAAAAAGGGESSAEDDEERRRSGGVVFSLWQDVWPNLALGPSLGFILSAVIF